MNNAYSNFPNDAPAELHPCEHMVTLVSRCSDDTLKGPAKWYTEFHVRTCANCREALRGLRAMRIEIQSINERSHSTPVKLSDHRWQQFHESLQDPS